MKKWIFPLPARIYKKEFSNLHPSPFYLTHIAAVFDEKLKDS